MQTIQKSTTALKLKSQHMRLVKDISDALAQLEGSLFAEKSFRRACQLDPEACEFHANLPALKFNMFIQLCKKESCKEYDFIHKFRADIMARGLMEEGG